MNIHLAQKKQKNMSSGNDYLNIYTTPKIIKMGTMTTKKDKIKFQTASLILKF